ncbi:MAG: hypothetical protein ABI612_14570, partial [Betaproteobacteria bacterium]
NWKNMLFSERNYRSLALLVRLLTELNDVPRDFPLLPFLQIDNDGTSAAKFRQMILANQQRDQIAVRLGSTTADILANNATFNTWFQPIALTIWRRFFGVHPGNGLVGDTPCFKGIVSHAISGDHPCPGPLFDWHRFAREVWDWWWYPYDTTALDASTTRRPYAKARRDTPLLEYYFDASGAAADYNRVHAALSITERFLLPLRTPIYAMANGVIVAARFATSNDPATSGFVLVRHEVFHRTAADRIDYDLAPTYVWSLTYYLENAAFDIPRPPPAVAPTTPADNSDWLNRFIVRLRECELAVQLHTAPANAANAALIRGWGHVPSGEGNRVATGVEIENDAREYRTLAEQLRAGTVALLPVESAASPTPLRMCLGDYLGAPNRMPGNQQGIQIEIFSIDKLDVPGATRRAVSASGEAWWARATGALRHEAAVGADLPADGMAWHYGMTDFLHWQNAITWGSEWQKYGLPGPAPLRPITRII